MTYSDTLHLLEYELSRIGAKKAFIQADVDEEDIRLDGRIRADRTPRSPRVIIAAQTKHGPISLPCDTYHDWKDNLRAIALSLEALRAVDRHGVTKRGEQYRGLKQIAGSTGPLNSSEAAAFIVRHCDSAATPAQAAAEILKSVDVFRSYYREAAKRLHPDAASNTSATEWHNLTVAEAILNHHHGIVKNVDAA